MLSRGRFLRGAMGLTTAAVGASLLAPGLARAETRAAPLAADDTAVQRTPTYSGSFSLAVDGKNLGRLRSFGGGSAYADVITEAANGAYFRRKHIGQVRWEPLSMEVGLGMDPSLYDLITRSWVGDRQQRDGTVFGFSATGQQVLERQFTDAVLQSVTLPTLDGASKEAAYLTLDLAPELTRDVAPSNTKPGSAPASNRQWLASNFKLSIAGLDTSRVSKIDSFTVSSGSAAGSIGATREPLAQPGVLDFPTLSVTFAQQSAQSWREWFTDFVIEGKHAAADHKAAQLSLLGPDLKTELARVELMQVGIVKLSPARQDAGSDQIAKLTAELYCERMEFRYFA